MNAPLRSPAAPALDPIRALHIEAFDALIEHRLADSTNTIGGRAALRMLQQLTDDGPGELVAYPGPSARLKLLGIQGHENKSSAYGILRNWQAAARPRLSIQL